MRLDASTRAAFLLGAILSWPVLRKVMDGGITTETAVVRIAIAMALAAAGVRLIVHVVSGYLPDPSPPAEETPLGDGVEDAVLVDSDRSALDGA